MEFVIFVLFAGMALTGAVFMVFLHDLVRSVLAMILSFVGVAGLYLVLEAEFIAAAAVEGRLSGPLGGVAPVPGIGVSNFRGRLDLVGITLDTVGPSGTRGLRTLLRFGKGLGAGTVNGTDQPIAVDDISKREDILFRRSV